MEGARAVDDPNGQQEPRVPPEPADPEAAARLAERMARLRDGARQNRSHADLIDGLPEVTNPRGRPPWRWVGAAGGVLAVGSLVVLVMLGSGGSASPPTNPTAEATSAPLDLPGAPTAAPRRTATGSTPSPGGSSAEEPVPEGAIATDSIRHVTPDQPPPLSLPSASRVSLGDRFGAPRGDGYVHAGVDLSNASGSGITAVAACNGKVTGIYELDGYGQFAVVDCGNSWRTIYAQLTTLTAKPGDEVTGGVTPIGSTTGPMHFEVRWDGVPFDPEAYVDFNAAPGPKPTPADAASATPTKTATPVPGGSTPEPGATSTPGSSGGGSVPTATATPAPAQATPTPTNTPTPQPPTPTRTPLPKPVIR
jgi:murein DD-endopeptidase MepM/ murein hydrolase activator NlpD